jgi:hypothetical protein
VALRTLPKIDVLIAITLGILLLCSAWGVSFSQSCKGDSCFGMIAPIGAWVIIFFVQLISLAIDALRRWRAKDPFALRSIAWLSASVCTAALPLFYYAWLLPLT